MGAKAKFSARRDGASQVLRVNAPRQASDRLAIREIAARYLNDVARKPTDLDHLAAKLGVVSVAADPLLSVAGELRSSEQGLDLRYFPDRSLGRQRFSIAHELGHAVFYDLAPSYRQPFFDTLESYCDMFAAEFLMPPEDLLPEVDQQHVTVKDVLRLASLFDVSVLSCLSQLSNLLGLVAFESYEGEIGWRCQRLYRPGLRQQIVNQVELQPSQDGAARIVIHRRSDQYSEVDIQWHKFHGEDRAIFLCSTL